MMNSVEDEFGRNFGTVYVHLDPLGIHAESPAKGMDSGYARQMAAELLQAADFFDQRRPDESLRMTPLRADRAERRLLEKCAAAARNSIGPWIRTA
jgi:hypothetical protein